MAALASLSAQMAALTGLPDAVEKLSQEAKNTNDKVTDLSERVGKLESPAKGSGDPWQAPPNASSWGNYHKRPRINENNSEGEVPSGASAAHGPSAGTPESAFRQAAETNSKRSGAGGPDEVNPCKLWVKGFERNVPNSSMKAYFEEALKPILGRFGEIKFWSQPFGFNFSLILADPTTTKAAFFHLREAMPTWRDDKNGTTKDMRISFDNTRHTRRMKFALHKVYSSTSEALKGNSVWDDGWRLATNPGKGILYGRNEAKGDIALLVQTELNDKGLVANLADLGGFENFGLSGEAVGKMLTKIRASINSE